MLQNCTCALSSGENPFQYSTLQGICRTIQGPSMLDLQEQTHLRPSDFQWIFMLCSISFPLGNFLGTHAMHHSAWNITKKSFHFRWFDDRSLSALPIHGIRHFLSGHFLCSNPLLLWTFIPKFFCSHS